MAGQKQTFSESWHRVANAKIALRPSLKVQRVFFRGELWHVLSDPFSNQFFRLRPAGYDFVARLDGTKTVEECWRDSLAHEPESAPGQEEVIQLLAQLYQSNLIRSQLAPDSVQLFERFDKRRRREIQSKWRTALFIRVPLFDPDAILKRALPYVRWLMGWAGAILWFAVVLSAGKVAIDNAGMLFEQGQSILSPSNLALLYLGMIFIKVVHEFGHGFACRHFGGEVHTMGVMLLVFTPVPFVDATSSWSFRSRWHRIFVSGAGMIVEIFVAALATFVWANTGPGAVHSLAYNMMFIASVSTLLFNANPLLRFDGYYILSDLVEIPNLHQRTGKLWKHVFEKYAFGNRKSVNPVENRQEEAFLLVFGALALVYRIFIFTGILLFVASEFLFVGVIIAMTGLITWLVLPVVKFVNYLSSSPRLERTRHRATGVTLGGLAIITVLLAVIPFPHSFSAPGIIEAENYSVVFVRTEGDLTEIVAPSGTRVRAGQPLLRFGNRELELNLTSVRAQLSEALAEEQQALSLSGENLEASRERIEAIQQELTELRRRVVNLELKAPLDGIWVAPDLEEMAGLWLSKGTQVGEIVDPQKFLFSAVTSQEDAAFLFSEKVRGSKVRIRGESRQTIGVSKIMIIQAEQRNLPSPALGWLAGGDVALDSSDSSGLRTAESFYEFRADLIDDGEVFFAHGRSGRIRCALPPEPLLPRGVRALRQLFQRRFGV